MGQKISPELRQRLEQEAEAQRRVSRILANKKIMQGVLESLAEKEMGIKPRPLPGD
ncbi:MAG: hypothetical protein WEB00_14905 [Dehalococcoidia bacterium]